MNRCEPLHSRSPPHLSTALSPHLETGAKGQQRSTQVDGGQYKSTTGVNAGQQKSTEVNGGQQNCVSKPRRGQHKSTEVNRSQQSQQRSTEVNGSLICLICLSSHLCLSLLSLISLFISLSLSKFLNSSNFCEEFVILTISNGGKRTLPISDGCKRLLTGPNGT